MFEWQEQIIIGTVLGGSSLIKPPRGTNYYLSMRSNNELWLAYKITELSGYFKNTKIFKYKKTYRCNSICSEKLTQIHDFMYQDNKRIITKELLEPLRDIGLAIWFLESGGKTGRDKKNVYLNSTRFGESGSELIKDYFNSLDIPCEINRNKKRLRIVFTVWGSLRFLKTTANCFPEFMFHRI